MELDKILRPDSKGRITLGRLMKGVSGYRVHFDESTKEITLTPLTEIPLSEQWLFKNKDALDRVKRGLWESSQGKISSKGSFSSYLED